MSNPWWKTPGVVRTVAMGVAIAAVSAVSWTFGWPVDWGIALTYGILQAIAMRWPIVMPTTGIRLTLVGGLIFEALWHHGLLTAIALLLIEFIVRMVTLYNSRPYWDWFRPMLMIFCLGAADLISRMVGGNWALYSHTGFPHIDTEAFAAVYAFWVLYYGTLMVIKAPERGRKPIADFLLSMQQTWWVPLVMLAVAWVMEVAHESPYNIRVLTGLVLLWAQYTAGPTFTAFFQDYAVANLTRLHPPRSNEARMRAQRILRVAYAISRTLRLPTPDMRLVGYAALLQDYLPDGDTVVPLWYPQPMTGEEREAVRRRVEAVARYIGQDGALTEVADVVRMRSVAYDGGGWPPLAGEAIPPVAQVLAAANAVVSLQEGPAPLCGNAEAVEWIRRHAPHRFSPRLLAAMSDCFRSPSETVNRGLPETVRQLQRLMATTEVPPTFVTGLRRMWAQLRGRIGFVPELPLEVQAVGRMANYFASSTDPDRTAQIAVEAVGQLVGAKVALAVSEGDNALQMRFRATYGFTELQMTGVLTNLDSPTLAHGLLSMEPLQLADLREVHTALAQEVARVESVRSILYVQLVARGRLTGMLMVGMPSYHWFTPREIGLIQLMADQAATALENARLMNEVAERLHHTESLKAFADTLLDSLNSSILVVDPESILVTVNASARERFGILPELEVGHPLPQELYAAFQVSRVLSGESVPEADVRWVDRILEVQAVPMRDSHGTLLGAICLARDVTEVRTMETQVRRVEKMAAIGELAAGAAHEIRNPLTSIRGFIQLVQARAAAAEGEYYQIIVNEIDRIDGIIHDLLLLARPSDPSRVPTSLAALINEILVLNEQKFKQNNIWASAEIDPEVERVPVDPKMFRQLLHNLVINAIQAMPFGGTLSLTVHAGEPGTVALEIADTGVGISSENMKRLFVPFFTTKEEGTGLGLALCYSIMQAHGGKIDVESREGLGTTFTVTLPAGSENL